MSDSVRDVNDQRSPQFAWSLEQVLMPLRRGEFGARSTKLRSGGEVCFGCKCFARRCWRRFSERFFCTSAH